MNIKKIINVKCVNKNILKQKKKNVFIVLQKNMVDLLAKNVDMIKILIILFVSNVQL
jgi:hypothetical protein